MRIIILVAIGSNYAIGKDGKLPWHGKQREDMKHFVDLTLGFPIIMGRKTYESIPKRPLPHRTNIVITRQDPYLDPNCIAVPSLADAIDAARKEDSDKAFVIGGGEIYKQALPLAHEIQLTLFHHEYEADIRFPAIDTLLTWREVERTDHEADHKNEHKYSFIRLVRVRKDW